MNWSGYGKEPSGIIRVRVAVIFLDEQINYEKPQNTKCPWQNF